MLYVEKIGVRLCVCAVCRTSYCGYGGVSVCCV